MKTNIFFCYVPTMSGVTCIILHGLDQNIDSHGKEKKQILQKDELPQEHKDLTLNQLELIYPYIEEKKNET